MNTDSEYPERDKILARMGAHTILKEHDDGDVTVRSGDKIYVVTTEGEVFMKIPPYAV